MAVDSLGAVGQKVVQMAEANMIIYGFVPGYAALHNILTGDYGSGTINIAVDVFGGALLRTPFQIGKHLIKVSEISVKVPAIATALRNAGVLEFKIIQRNSGTKYAIIGQTMDRITNSHTILDDMFNTKVVTFVESAAAKQDWADKTQNYTKILTSDEIKQTIMWQENVAWINKMKAEGYNFIDIGRDYLKSHRGIFYDMERSFVYFP